MLGLRPWLAFFRRTLAFFLEVRFDMAVKATGDGAGDSRRAPGDCSETTVAAGFAVRPAR